MPSTARFSLNTNTPVNQLIDDNLVSQYGRHDSIALAAGVAQTVTWPATAETLVYIRFPAGATTVTIKAVATDATGWVVTVPAANFLPVLMPKPSTGTIVLSSTAAVPIVDLYFF